MATESVRPAAALSLLSFLLVCTVTTAERLYGIGPPGWLQSLLVQVGAVALLVGLTWLAAHGADPSTLMILAGGPVLGFTTTLLLPAEGATWLVLGYGVVAGTAIAGAFTAAGYVAGRAAKRFAPPV